MINIGFFANTHGIKGEIKVISDFKYKDIVFKKDSTIYINDKKYIIYSHRVHKSFDLITLDGINNINDIINLKGSNIYIKKEDYTFPSILNEELYGKKVYDKNKYIGRLKNIIKNKSQEILVVENEKEYLIPYVDEFVKSIDEDIHLELIKGFIDEN